jgi:fructokinase
MTATPGPIVGLGEILWDLLPQGKLLGGAPANFAYRCHRLGHPAVVVSRVGADDLGRQIRTRLQQWGLSDALLQEDPEHPTGTVTVELDPQGVPDFTIVDGVAYDYLAWSDELEELCTRARAVCFGTLCQRQPIARETIQRALQTARNALTIYDVNLRQPYYSREVIEASLHASRWVKLNDGELGELRELLELQGTSPEAVLADLRKRYRLELAALTLGKEGCTVQTDQDHITVPGIPVEVAHTVGAGDAFTAGLVTTVLEGKTISAAAVFANRLAARVVEGVE